MIDIVGKQNITFNLTFRSTFNFRRNYFGCNVFFFFFFCILINFLFCYVLHLFYILTYEHGTRKEKYKKRKGKLNIIQRRLTHNYILTKKKTNETKNPVPSFLFT